MESLIKTQDALKEGSRKLNSMLEEMEQKQVRHQHMIMVKESWEGGATLIF